MAAGDQLYSADGDPVYDVNGDPVIDDGSGNPCGCCSCDCDPAAIPTSLVVSFVAGGTPGTATVNLVEGICEYVSDPFEFPPGSGVMATVTVVFTQHFGDGSPCNRDCAYVCTLNSFFYNYGCAKDENTGNDPTGTYNDCGGDMTATAT